MNVAEMEGVAAKLSLSGFDLLVVADGSGTVAGRPYGWHYVAYEPAAGVVTEGAGGASGGTNNVAELAPFIHALGEYHARGGNGAAARRVELVSDSEVTVRCGTRKYGRYANLPLWGAVDWFEAHGYSLGWTHVRRNSNPASERADAEGRAVRLLFERHLSPRVQPRGPT